MKTNTTGQTRCCDMLHQVKNDLIRRRGESKATLKDIQTVLNWHQARIGGQDHIADELLSKVFKTKLYINHGGEYCELLEILN